MHQERRRAIPSRTDLRQRADSLNFAFRRLREGVVGRRIDVRGERGFGGQTAQEDGETLPRPIHVQRDARARVLRVEPAAERLARGGHVVAEDWGGLDAFEEVVGLGGGEVVQVWVRGAGGVIGRLPAGVFVVGRAVEGKDCGGWGDTSCDGGEGEGHAEVAAGGPADGDDFGGVDAEGGEGEGECGKRGAAPGKGIADVCHGARGDGDFGAEAVVDADGEEAVVEEELGLLAPDIFA